MALHKKALVWKGVTVATGAATGFATQRLLAFGWAKVAGHDPPTEPGDRSNSLPESIMWAIAAGVGFGVARVLTARSAAVVWERATDEAPPTGVKVNAA